MTNKPSASTKQIVIKSATKPKLPPRKVLPMPSQLPREVLLDDQITPAEKTDMDQLYDSRHEFEPSSVAPEGTDTTWFEDSVYNAPDLLNVAQPANLPRWMQANQDSLKLQEDDEDTTTTKEEEGGPLTLQEIEKALKDMAAIRVNVIDVRAKVDHFDYVVICEGRSTRHVYSITDGVRILVCFRRPSDFD
jgi:hypothetical protein